MKQKKEKLIIKRIAIVALIAYAVIVAINARSSLTKSTSELNLNDGTMTLTFIDVDQGDSILVCYQDFTMLIDTGKYSEYDKVKETLAEHNVRDIDIFVATHMDGDHMGSAASILEDYDVKTIWATDDFDKDTKSVELFKKAITDEKVMYPEAGYITNSEYLKIMCLGPISSEKGYYSDSNSKSIVLRLDYGNTSFLLTGDETCEEYNDVISKKTMLKTYYQDVDVLKLTHHGSATDGTNSYGVMSDANPTYAVISVGEYNEYGHPHQEVLDSLKKMKDTTRLQTDEKGNITFTTDGDDLDYSTER